MAAINVVRFRVKPGQEQEFVDFHRRARPRFKGFEQGWLLKTGDRAYCLVAVWRSFKHIADARPEMIGMLDGVRDLLEDLGGGLGVTDPVSGEVVAKLALSAPKSKAAAAKPARRKPAKKAVKKSAKRKKASARKA